MVGPLGESRSDGYQVVTQVGPNTGDMIVELQDGEAVIMRYEGNVEGQVVAKRWQEFAKQLRP